MRSAARDQASGAGGGLMCPTGGAGLAPAAGFIFFAEVAVWVIGSRLFILCQQPGPPVGQFPRGFIGLAPQQQKNRRRRETGDGSIIAAALAGDAKRCCISQISRIGD